MHVHLLSHILAVLNLLINNNTGTTPGSDPGNVTAADLLPFLTHSDGHDVSGIVARILTVISNTTSLDVTEILAGVPGGLDGLVAVISNRSAFNVSRRPSNDTALLDTASSVIGHVIPWNNPDNVITQDVSDYVTFLLQCVTFPIVTAFGLTGNVMSLIVILRKTIRNSTTSIVLCGLLLSDSMFLIMNMLRKSTCIVRQVDTVMADDFSAKTFAYVYYMKLAFSRVSSLLVVVISIERLIAVAFPLKVRSIVTQMRMFVAVCACFVITFGGMALLPAQYTYKRVAGRIYIAKSEFALNNTAALKTYNEYVLPIAYRYVPSVLVLCLNITIICVYRRNRRWSTRDTCSSESTHIREDEQRRLTKMLLSVAFIFLFCLIPGDVLLLCSDLIKEFSFFGKYHNIFLVLSDISLLFEIVNASINFIIYMFLNKNFHDTYFVFFCACVHKRRRPVFKSSANRNQTSDGSQRSMVYQGSDGASSNHMPVGRASVYDNNSYQAE